MSKLERERLAETNHPGLDRLLVAVTNAGGGIGSPQSPYQIAARAERHARTARRSGLGIVGNPKVTPLRVVGGTLVFSSSARAADVAHAFLESAMSKPKLAEREEPEHFDEMGGPCDGSER